MKKIIILVFVLFSSSFSLFAQDVNVEITGVDVVEIGLGYEFIATVTGVDSTVTINYFEWTLD
jgi:hypothetical protein